MDTDFLKDKKVMVMGLGRFGGGVDSARFAADRGADVTVTDLAEEDQLAKSIKQLSEYPRIKYRLGTHRVSDFESADIVIANPAVPPGNKFLQIARDNGGIVTSQISLFFSLCPAKTIGITGSNGKSTTTALTAHILRNMPQPKFGKVWLSGNIGNEPLLMLLGKIKPDDLVVLELSSFQVEQLDEHKQAPEIALLINLLPNHLDRYGTFENYCTAKELIFRNQKADTVSIFNRDDERAARWFEKYSRDRSRRCITFGADDVSDCFRKHYTLGGKCNLANLAAALAIVRQFDVDNGSIINCLDDFRALPHRLELIAEQNGVKWYNDSKATTPEATIAAIEAFEEPVILIAGGYDKKLAFEELAEVIADRVKAILLIGETAAAIAEAIKKVKPQNDIQITPCESLERAVTTANQKARQGDVVLLSPACASYDMFENYEQRGEVFTQLARRS